MRRATVKEISVPAFVGFVGRNLKGREAFKRLKNYTDGYHWASYSPSTGRVAFMKRMPR